MLPRFPILPPLPVLRTFEAVARHGSFADAADELNVTPSAVSHQIRSLEEHFGVKLFRRLNPGIELSEEGRLLMEGVDAGLGRIFDVCDRVRTRRVRRVLRISATSQLASWWLAPLAATFAADHPEVDLEVTGREGEPDLARDGLDLAIVKLRNEAVRALEREHPLFRDIVFPVCSPSLPTIERPLARPEDLAHHMLLQEEQFTSPDIDWALWLRHFNLAEADRPRPRFSHFSMVVAAAIAGQGVALGRSPLIDEELAAGRLIRPFGTDVWIPATRTYVLRWSQASEADPAAVALRGLVIATALRT